MDVKTQYGMLKAKDNMFNFFYGDDLREMAGKFGGAEAFQAAIKGKTINQVAKEFTLTYRGNPFISLVEQPASRKADLLEQQ